MAKSKPRDLFAWTNHEVELLLKGMQAYLTDETDWPGCLHLFPKFSVSARTDYNATLAVAEDLTESFDFITQCNQIENKCTFPPVSNLRHFTCQAKVMTSALWKLW